MNIWRSKFKVVSALVVLSVCATSCASVLEGPADTNASDSDRYSADVFLVSDIAEKAYRESRWTDAARHYQQLTEEVPSDAYIWFRLANTYAHKGSYNQAIHAYEMSIERDSLQAKPWFNLSTTYLLSAKVAMLQSWENLRPRDPARQLIIQRIEALDSMMNQDLGELRVRGG